MRPDWLSFSWESQGVGTSLASAEMGVQGGQIPSILGLSNGHGGSQSHPILKLTWTGHVSGHLQGAP